MRGSRAVRLVAARELREAYRRRSTWIVLAVFFFGSVAAMVVPVLIGDDGPTTHALVVVGDPAPLRAQLGAARTEDDRYRVDEAADAAAARAEVDDGEVEVGVVPGRGDDAPTLYVRSGEHEQTVGVVRSALATVALVERLEVAGLAPDEVASALDVPDARVQEVDTASGDRRLAAFAVSLVLYLLLLSLMTQVANGVAIEKGNRIIEVLLAIVTPDALLFGKVVGVGITGAIGVAAGLLPVAVKLTAGGDLPSGLVPAVVGGAAWFVLGLALYLLLAAALASLVERQEEAGAVMSPLMGVLIGSFLVAQTAPDSRLGAVLALFPLSSPLVEPSRIAIGVAGGPEMAASLALLVASALLAARIGSLVYGRAVVRTGRRLRLREVLTG